MGIRRRPMTTASSSPSPMGALGSVPPTGLQMRANSSLPSSSMIIPSSQSELRKTRGAPDQHGIAAALARDFPARPTCLEAPGRGRVRKGIRLACLRLVPIDGLAVVGVADRNAQASLHAHRTVPPAVDGRVGVRAAKRPPYAREQFAPVRLHGHTLLTR